jgi:predicted DNA-binding protein (MmcQ/YjbR family)
MVMAVLSPEVFDLVERLRQIALDFPNSEEYFPWGGRAYFRDIKGRNFLFANEKSDALEVVFRIPAGQRDTALQLANVTPYKYMSERGWLSANIKTRAELDQIQPWIATSYALNKPIRRPDEIIEGEMPHVLDFLEQIRQLACAYPDVEEYFPYGDRAFRTRKRNIFLYASEADEYLYLNIRLPYGEREYALTLPFTEVPKYIGNKGWVGAKIRTPEELETVKSWLHLSYDMNNPPRRKK